MADPHASYTFCGVEHPKACQYTRSLGITPGQVTMTLAPQDSFVSQIGILKMTYEDQEIELARVRCDAATLRKSPTDPRLWELTAFDRRWEWAYGDTPRASYNVRDGDGNVIAATQKTPQQLATLLFGYMGETDYEVSLLPNTNDDGDAFWPEMSWDHDVPAEKLAELLEMCGCDVSLGLDDVAWIESLGYGSHLPDGGIVSKSRTIDLPEPVHEIRALADRSQYQVDDVLLDAVGLDTDGAVKLLINLAYAPAGGWSSICAPDTWDAIVESVVLPDGRIVKPRETYQKSVYKWYRLPDTFNVPGLGVALSREDLLPCVDLQVDTMTENGVKKRKPAEVYGVVRTDFAGGYQNTAADTLCETKFDLDTETGIVKFSEYVYQYGNVNDPANKTNLPATLKLRCSIQGEREGVSEDVNADSALPTKTLTTNDVCYMYKTTPVNDAAVAAVLWYLVDQWKSKMQRLTIQERTYNGLREIDTDGLVRQVTWQCSTDAAATTSASENSEMVDPSVMPEKVRRVYEKLRGMLK